MKSKGDIISDIAKATGYRKEDISIVIEAFENIVSYSVSEEGNTIRFGPVEVGLKKIKERKGFSALTGKEYVSEEHLMPYAKIRGTFKLDYKKKLKDSKENKNEK